MRIIDINTLRKIFLELLDEAKYNVSLEGFGEAEDVRFGEDPDSDYHEKIFTEYGIYNESIAQAPNNISGYITPGMFAYDGAEIINNPSFDAYNVMVAFEFLAFEEQREIFRKILEKLASNIRGKSFTIYELGPDEYVYDFTGNNIPEAYKKTYTAVIATEMPVLGETVQQSGYDRFSAYINMDLTVLSTDIELALAKDVTIDGKSMSLNSVIFQREKSTKAFNVRTKETQSYAENQTINISINGILRGDDVSKKIENNILGSDFLNEKFTIRFRGHTYEMFLKSGQIELTPNSPLNFTAVFSTRKEV